MALKTTVWVIGLAVLSACCAAANGQWDGSNSPISSFDSYGNARFRSVGRDYGLANPIFQPPVVAPGSAIMASRRAAGLGDSGPSRLPSPLGVARSNVFGLTTRGLTGGGAESLPRSYQMYGGFDRRSGRAYGDIGVAIQRRDYLVQATGSFAPVRRAMMRHATSANPMDMVERTPFLVAETSPDVEPIQIDRGLAAGIDVQYTTVLGEAWDAFGEIRYRHAARLFEAAATLKPAELEPLVGELFCHMGLGSFRTSAGSLRGLLSRHESPFADASRLNMAGRFARASDVGDVAIQVRLFAARNKDNESAALDVFVQWCLHRFDDAKVSAAALARSAPESEYVNWPGMMQAAMEDSTGSSGTEP